MHGFLLINKALGRTSFDEIRVLRRITGERRIGHAGTLDPLATGLLIVAIGRATSLLPYLITASKTYQATLKLGFSTVTYDTEGEEVFVSDQKPPRNKIEQTIKDHFLGTIQQTPPAYSAVNINGQRAYQLARKGENIVIPARSVHILGIKILNYEYPFLKLEINCGSGTYIRSLGNDLGRMLETGAYVTALERTAINDYRLEQSICTDLLNKNNVHNFILSINDISLDFPKFILSEEEASRLRHGQTLPVSPSLPAGIYQLREGTKLLAIGFVENALLRPRRVFDFEDGGEYNTEA